MPKSFVQKQAFMARTNDLLWLAVHSMFQKIRLIFFTGFLLKFLKKYDFRLRLQKNQKFSALQKKLILMLQNEKKVRILLVKNILTFFSQINLLFQVI